MLEKWMDIVLVGLIVAILIILYFATNSAGALNFYSKIGGGFQQYPNFPFKQ